MNPKKVRKTSNAREKEINKDRVRSLRHRQTGLPGSFLSMDPIATFCVVPLALACLGVSTVKTEPYNKGFVRAYHGSYRRTV